MRRHIFHFVYLIGIAIGILFLGSCTNNKQSLSSTTSADDSIQQIEAKSEIALKESNLLEEAILNDLNTRSANTKASSDYFGGIYLDDNFDIVVVIKGDIKDFQKKFIDDNVKTIPCHIVQGDFSLKELHETQNTILSKKGT